MLRVYLSSTYQDLKDFRGLVADGVKQLGHLPVGMEDYVAEGSRPLAKCVQDVADSDVYVGIFAWRYGYVPDDPIANPTKLSITELELETAIRELGPENCLIFILDPSVAWPPDRMDARTRENSAGQRIDGLKERLEKEFTVGHFKSEQHLAQLVNTSISRLPPPPERHVRQLNYDTVIAYADPADQATASALGEALGWGDRAHLDPRILFTVTPLDFRELERKIVQTHSVVLLVTPTLLGLLKGLPDEGARAVRVLHERTDAVIAALQGVAAAALPAGWPAIAVVDVPGPIEPAVPPIRAAIEARSPTRGRSTVGLPYIVLSMSAAEAADLFEGRDPGAQLQRFKDLLPGLRRGGDPVARYGPERRGWKPFGVKTAAAIAAEIAGRVNSGSGGPGQRLVKLQYYAFTPWLEQSEALLGIYTDLLATGCVTVVDQVSLFHERVGEGIATFLGRSTDQVAVVAMSPPESLSAVEVQLIERQARERLAGVFTRFDAELDPTCEFGIAEERRLRRWLRASVPAAVNNLAELRPDENRKRRFRELTAPQRRMGAEALLWPDRAG